MKADFWTGSGFQLLDHDAGGGLKLTDDFIKAFLARPELMPPADACPVERGLHAQLLRSPRIKIDAEALNAVADRDARENLTLFLSFRDRLMKARTLEAAYVSLFAGSVTGIPPLFLQQLTHVVARNAFSSVEDAFVLRAAECFFRAQRVSFHEGQVLLADQEAIADHEHSRHHSPLLTMLGGPAVTELEVLNETNAGSYAIRSDAHDLVLNIASDRGRTAMGEAARVWIRHLTGIDLVFEPVARLDEEAIGWFLAFDSEASRMGNAVWAGTALSPDQAGRVLALYKFKLPEHGIIHAHRGKTGFAIVAASPDHNLAIKPQNMIAGLPLARKG